MEMKDRIKSLRTKYNLTLEDVGNAVGVGKSTVRKWENGDIANMRRDKIAKLASALHTTPGYLMGWEEDTTNSPAPVTPMPSSVSPRYAELTRIDDALNTAGHEQFVQYGEYLTARPEYQQNGEVYEAPVSYIREYLTPPAAGYAAPIEGSDYVDVPRDNLTPPTADFCVRVSGDSMEPHIKDGQRVYVRRDVVLEDFDVGVFFYDGQVFIKQYCPSYDGSVYLMSANPMREDANIFISRNSSSTLICFGKVLLGRKLPMPNYK